MINNKKKLRSVIDYRKLNSIIIKNLTLLSFIGNIIDNLIRAKYFTKINLRDIFNQIRIKKENKKKTAFKNRFRIFKYLVISFRLINTPVIFQRYINKVLSKVLEEEKSVYIDDILITEITREQY